ncbi:MAG: mismatch-specific DNA-glycosylase [Solirubrobacterales bacterium]
MTTGVGWIVEDVIEPGLAVVFCGTALGAESARRRAYYAGPGNKFWPTLAAVGLTPRRLAPEEYPGVLEWGIGLTDLCKTRSGSDAEIGLGGFDPDALRERIAAAAPAWLAFTSKHAAKNALGLKAVDYGVHEQRFGGAAVFVLPSPSGAASGHWDIGRWQELADLVASARAS